MSSPTQKEMARITRMDWQEFEDRLQAATRSPSTTSDEQALRQYFGDEEFEELERLAAQTRAMRQRAPVLGNVVFLPGIMGSNLASVEASGDEDLVWVNLARLVLGQLERLKLSSDGSREEDPNYKVIVMGIDKRTYSRALIRLGARWNVLPFAFDWRKDIDESSHALAKFIQDKFGDEPVHLVAHSMGGLLCRNFIVRHKELWEKMRGDGRGGRLIMMGTPNYGSFAIPQAMTGDEKLVRWLARFDLEHDLAEILEIINTFVGSYQMLPAPSRIPEAMRDIYQRDTWGSYPVSELHLKRALEFHRQLEDEATIDPERMTYIAGCNRPTLSGLETLQPGRFRYFVTTDGDGRVPFNLGLLEGVPVYYVEEDHGSLPKNDKVLTAIDQLLERGRTLALPDRRVAARTIIPEGTYWHRSVGDYLVGAELEEIALALKRGEAGPDEIRIAEETLRRAALGEERPARKLAQKKSTQPRNKKPLRVEVVLGDITRVAVPVVVVGHYKGVTPINAIGALDRALGGWIRYAAEHSMLGGDLGQLFFIPVKEKQIAAEAVLVAGMGEEGKFTHYDLYYLMLNVTSALSALRIDRFATVLIGSGAGNLTIERALRSLLFGICDGLDRLSDRGQVRISDLNPQFEIRNSKSPIKSVILIERDPERHQQSFEILERIKAETAAAGFEIEVVKRVLPGARQTVKAGGTDQPGEPQQFEFGPRITIERDGDVFRFSALTRTAVVPVREVEIQSFFVEGIADRLIKSCGKEEQEMFGRVLATSLMPEDFQQYYDTEDSLTLILDRSTAAFPWEMACYERPSGLAFFGTHLRLARQFRTLLSRAPGVAPKLNDQLKVLVIADPAPEPELQLPGAREEGRQVVRLLNQIRQEYGLRIEVIDRIGAAECEPIEILGLILGEEFDVIHFAGHAIFDQEKPSHSGWVFGRDPARPGKLRILSAREIFRARLLPRLVFANACFSAVVNQGKALGGEEMNRSLAGIAEAFFERGVQNYIGAGWPVEDNLAILFATEFYARALAGRSAKDFQANASLTGDKAFTSKRKDYAPASLGDALVEARKLILHDGSTWGAYQHYGQASTRLIVKPAESSRSEAGSNSDSQLAPSRRRKARSKQKR